MAITFTGYSALAWTTTIVALVVVAVRLFVRFKIRAFGTDDWFMLMAVIWAICTASLAQTNWNNLPANGHYPADWWTRSTMGNITSYLSVLCSKTSVGLLLLRVFSTNMTRYRMFISVSLGGLWGTTFLGLISSFFPICTPPQLALKSMAGCLPYNVYLGFFETWSFYGVVLDFAYSTLPLAIIIPLHTSKDRKIALGLLLGLGWITSAFTLVKAVGPYSHWSSEQLNDILPVATYLESALVIICGSLATLTPLYTYWTSGQWVRPRSDLRPHGYNTFGEQKHDSMHKSSMSTVVGGNPSSQPGSDHSGIRVEKQFDVTSSHQDEPPV